MTTPNKRWRELAKDCYENIECIYARGLTDGEILDAEYFIAKAIETAVDEERARMVVVWPSDEVLNKGCAEWYKNRTDNDHPLEMLQVIWGGCYRWLRTQAKTGERDE